jgi:uncharacterized repeat protein (TIGR03803 family)
MELFVFGWMLSAQTGIAQTFTVLHSFTGGADGGFPTGSLVFDQAGNIYGTTLYGGGVEQGCYFGIGCGVVYKYSPSSDTLMPLYTFLDGDDGELPNAGVIFGPDGALYGTASGGGAHNFGTIFRVAPPAHGCTTLPCPWTETTLLSFNGSDGEQPLNKLAFDQGGNLYGTAFGGCTWGEAFELPAPLGDLPLEMLHCFGQGSDGKLPSSGVVIDSSGNLYGVTQEGGTYDGGTAYELSPSGSGWIETILHNFGQPQDGSEPYVDLILDAAGNLYGGTDDAPNVFELSPSQGGWVLTTLFRFDQTPLHFTSEFRALARDNAGNLYGARRVGGPYGNGNVFKLSPSGGSWTYTNLHDFVAGDDGYFPSGLGVGPDGALYGTSSEGGDGAGCQGHGTYCGVLWQITP